MFSANVRFGFIMVVPKNIFYSYAKIISYNAQISFLNGGRGVGKTYGAIVEVVCDFLKKGKQFVYLRRFMSEIETAVPKFFDALIDNNEFPGHEFKVKKNKHLTTFLIDGKIAGFAAALTTSQILKSTAFPLVRTIIFDEYIIDKGAYHYLNNECDLFMDVIETVFRMRDGRVWCLANSVSISNPYFEYKIFNLSMPYESQFKICRRDENGNPLVVIQRIKNADYEKAKSKTAFGQLISGYDYGNYAINNEFLRDSKTWVEKRPSGNSRNYSVIILNGHKYGVWLPVGSELVYLCRDYDPSNPCCYTIDPKWHDDHSILVTARRSRAVSVLVDSFKGGFLRFENSQIRNDFDLLLRKCCY